MNNKAKKANRKEVESYLNVVKRLSCAGDDTFVLQDRDLNMKFLANIGFTIHDAQDVISNLKYNDYYAGPKKDFNENFGGYIWEFKRTVNDVPVYIKLKVYINKKNGKKMLKCISFHKDKYPSQSA